MTARRSVLEHDADRRMFDRLRRIAGALADDDVALAQYIGACLRLRWTWKLIGQALGVTPRRAASIWRRDLERRGIA